MQHLIANVETIDPIDSVPLFWANEFGWVDAIEADLFSQSERDSVLLPLGGVWCTKDEASYFLNFDQGESEPTKPCDCERECVAEKVEGVA